MKDFVLGQFADEAALCAAAVRLRELGYRDLDAYSPVPIHGVDEALGLRKSIVPKIGFVGGLLGAITGYAFQTWMNAFDYPINVANRPLHAPPANVPVTFECTVLFSVVAIVFGFFALCGFPRPHHPVMDVEAFRNATVDGLWLSALVDVGAAAAVVDELGRLGATNVSRVAEEHRWEVVPGGAVPVGERR